MDFPFGLQDIAKAVREIIKIFDEVAKRSGKVVEFYHARGRKDAASKLEYLRFHEGGMIKQLRIIASGKFSEADIDELRGGLDATADGVDDAIFTLNDYRNAIREQLNLKTAIVLDEILEGEDGKKSIRRYLHELSVSGPFDEEWHRKDLQSAATRVLRKIEVLNRNTIDLHDSLIEGKKIGKLPAGRSKVEPSGKRPSKAKKKATGLKHPASAKA
jgi:hypothetical protein